MYQPIERTIAFGAAFVFGGAAAQPYALLTRKMQFTRMAAIQIGSLAFAAAVAIFLALLGARYWSLVAMAVAHGVFTAAGSIVLSGWMPGRPGSWAEVRSMVWFGTFLTGHNVSTHLIRSLDKVLIGAVFGAGPLGLYAKAYALVLMPLQQIGAPLNGAVLPALSRVQQDRARFRRAFLLAIGACCLLAMPAVAFCFVASESVILAILGPQWTEAVPVFRLLAPAAFLSVLMYGPVWILTVRGETRRLFRWSAVVLGMTCVGASNRDIGDPGSAVD